MKLRITLLIPAILLLAAFLSSVLMFNHSLSYEEDRIRKRAKETLNFDITRLQNILYNLLTEGKHVDARLNVSMTAMGQSFKKLLIIDENENIIIANRYSWEGNKAIEVSDYDVKLARSVKNSNKPELIFDKTTRENIELYYPVVLEIENKEGLPVKRIGTLYAEVSIKRELAQAYDAALNEALYYGTILVVTSLLIALVLHIRISKRLNILSNASLRLAKGDFKARAKLSGNDEISVLANSFDMMAKQIQTNIDELKEAESNLLELNANLEDRVIERTELLREAQRIAHMGNWQWNIKTGDIIWSDEVYRIIGYEPGEIALDLDRFTQFIHEDDRDMVSNAIDKALNMGSKYSIEHRIIHKDGTTRWLHEEGYVYTNDKDEPEFMRGIAIDITDHKEEEQQRNKLERQLQQAQKMEAIGQLTGGIAHDFNNMLASIKGFSELAQQLAVNESTGKLNDYLKYIEVSTERAAQLVSQMLAFSRTETGIEKKEVLSIELLLDETISMLRPVLPSSINLNIDIESNLPKVEVNPVMVHQVLMNLCVNAKDAMEGSQGEINIKVKQSNEITGQCASCHKDVSGDFVEILVSDTGSGIPAENHYHLFEPFYTTKEVGKGTGMGLSMVHGIMHKHQGHILIDSVPGQGSTFHLLFPAVDIAKEDGQQSKDETDKKSPGTKTVNIMIVDDEESITFFLKEFLEMNGYYISVYNSSPEALAEFKKQHHDIHLVITDFTMPEMTGVQMADSMLQIKPELPVILCSGYGEEIDNETLKEKSIKTYLEKPIDTAKLLSAIQLYST